ncbi:MAG: TolC family protein [Bryobacteraceae bacterium]
MNKTKFVRLLIFLSAIMFGLTTFGQSPAGSGAAPGPGMQVDGGSGAAVANGPSRITIAPQEGDPAYQGSVPQGTVSPSPISLTLAGAINRGLKANLGLLTSEQSSRQTRAERYRALAGLLPTVTGQVSMTEQQLNLQALGFAATFPPNLGFQIPKIVGPYSYQSAQANATIPLFDYTAISNYRSSRESLKASALSLKNARDLVVQAVSNAYLEIIADAARVTATQAEIEADNAVYLNATRRHEAGVAIAIDVLRSQVELKQRQQALVAETNQFEKDKLSLARIIGLPIGQDFTVADPSPSVPLEAISLQDALAKAYEHRPDFQAARAQVAAAEFSLRAAKAQRYPTLQASGFYGDEGLRLLTNSHGVFQATGSLQFNIFDGGRIKADILQNDVDLRNRRNDLENLQGQIDYEVRSALLDLKSAGAQVDVARSNVDLANQTLKQARDRFAAGVTNTVEVVQAQQSLADADENVISAQYQYNVAKVSLARSLGLAEEGIRTYFNKQP